MSELKVRRHILIPAIFMLLGICICGCGRKVTTVADDINSDKEQELVQIREFELKGESSGDIPKENGYCAILIPAEYHASEEVEGMYVSESYPYESSSIFYSVLNPEEDGAVSSALQKSEYEEALEKAFDAVGTPIELSIDEFEAEVFEGLRSYRIRSHYSKDGQELQQLCYIILAAKTHVITYTQASDDELLLDFLTDEGQIKLIRDAVGD